MTKIQSACGSNVMVIEYWNLRFICNLVLVIWDFKSCYLGTVIWCLFLI
jgi:hypothetical protein